MSMQCKVCGKRAYSDYCVQHKPKKPLKRTRIKQRSKESFKWQDFRKKYLELHPPNHEGYYICYLCHKWVTAEDITLDHVEARSHSAHLRYNEDNIEFCCGPCNSRKGSQSLENYLKTLT